MPDIELYELVAEKLSGRNVRVDFKKPMIRGVRGEFTRDDDTGYIRISPDLDVRNRLWVYLHEAAHALLHWDDVESSNFHTLGSELIEPMGNHSDEYQQHEEQATEQGRAWFTFAENQCRFIFDDEFYEEQALYSLYFKDD